MPNRIDTTLANAREAGRSALGPYITVGYPDVPTSTDIAEAVLESGADMLELGIPFSDPLAEGPTIQKSSFHALQQGVTMNASLDVLRDLRQRGVDSPLIFMGYINPFLAYGMERFARDAAAAGLDGVILPDLPAEESTRVRRHPGGERHISGPAAGPDKQRHAGLSGPAVEPGGSYTV